MTLPQVEEMKKRLDEARKDYDKRREHLKEGKTTAVLLFFIYLFPLPLFPLLHPFLYSLVFFMSDIKQLNRDLSSKKQEVQVLMSEMESTAQAFEDMQEQNIRLLQQLRVSSVCEHVCG